MFKCWVCWGYTEINMNITCTFMWRKYNIEQEIKSVPSNISLYIVYYIAHSFFSYTYILKCIDSNYYIILVIHRGPTWRIKSVSIPINHVVSDMFLLYSKFRWLWSNIMVIKLAFRYETSETATTCVRTLLPTYMSTTYSLYHNIIVFPSINNIWYYTCLFNTSVLLLYQYTHQGI